MATRAEKDAEHRFRECIKRERKHLRAGSGRQDGTEVRHIGSASECCKRGDA